MIRIVLLLFGVGMIIVSSIAVWLSEQKMTYVRKPVFVAPLFKMVPKSIVQDAMRITDIKEPLKQNAPKQQPQPKEKISYKPTLVESTTPRSAPEEIPINIRTVVVLRCSFYNAAARSRLKAYGSGAIVSSRGHILTARHVVDMEYAYRVTNGRQGARGYQLESCEVGQPPEGSRAPVPQEIRAINPFTAIDFLPYRAEIAFLLDEAGMSDAEKDFIDVAVLRIGGVTDDAKKFFNVALPAAFDMSVLAKDQFPAVGEEIVSFGFPSGAPSYGSNFNLQGSVGEVEGIVGGDKQFKDQPIGIAALMETIGGRSGSPVFWHGKIIGVISSKEDYTKNATVISVYPLMHMLQGLDIGY